MAGSNAAFGKRGTPRQFRVGGSGFTVFTWEGEVIAFAQTISHTSPAPVGGGAVPIQPLDARHPLEIITPAAVGMGQLTLEIQELYGDKVWGRLKHIANSTDLAEIFLKVANTPNPITVARHVRPPKTGTRVANYVDLYHNAVITNVMDGENIEVGTMQIVKQVQIGYTHTTRDYQTDNQDN